jgi:DNA-binding NarL/FixJ family response regulator
MIDPESVKATPRGQQVLNLLVPGLQQQRNCRPLNISPRTVKRPPRTLFLRAETGEGRKRIKLSIARFSKNEARS